MPVPLAPYPTAPAPYSQPANGNLISSSLVNFAVELLELSLFYFVLEYCMRSYTCLFKVLNQIEFPSISRFGVMKKFVVLLM